MKQIQDLDINALEIVALAAAQQASALLNIGFYSDLEVKQKSHAHDLVTQFDTKSEELIISVIKDSYSNHAFVGEESGIQGDVENEITWIIDPIDGTWNFAKQIPSFAISIAVYYKKAVHLGVCIDPIANEIFIARKGKGATMNGKKLSVSKVSNLEHSGISLGSHIGFDDLHKIAQIRRSGSTVLDLCYVAKGSLEGFIDNRQRIWDYAAAQLVVVEAGGTVSCFDNSPLSFDFKNRTQILASNGIVHQELMKWISMEKK